MSDEELGFLQKVTSQRLDQLALSTHLEFVHEQNAHSYRAEKEEHTSQTGCASVSKYTYKVAFQVHALLLIHRAKDIRYLTQITYIFPTNSSIFRCRQTRISMRMRSDFPHDSTVIFRKIPRGRQDFTADSCGKWRISRYICM